MLTCDEFNIAILKLINVKYFSVLIFNIVNIDKCNFNIHTQNFFGSIFLRV